MIGVSNIGLNCRRLMKMPSPLEAKNLQFVEEKIGNSSVFILHKRGSSNLRTAILLSMRRHELEKRRKWKDSIKRAKRMIKENGEREERAKPRMDLQAEVQAIIERAQEKLR
jgi:hypothetical protein